MKRRVLQMLAMLSVLLGVVAGYGAWLFHEVGVGERDLSFKGVSLEWQPHFHFLDSEPSFLDDVPDTRSEVLCAGWDGAILGTMGAYEGFYCHSPDPSWFTSIVVELSWQGGGIEQTAAHLQDLIDRHSGRSVEVVVVDRRMPEVTYTSLAETHRQKIELWVEKTFASDFSGGSSSSAIDARNISMEDAFMIYCETAGWGYAAYEGRLELYPSRYSGFDLECVVFREWGGENRKHNHLWLYLTLDFVDPCYWFVTENENSLVVVAQPEVIETLRATGRFKP